MLLAFLIDQGEMCCCGLFGVALEKMGRLKYLRNKVRGIFEELIIPSWGILYAGIVHGHKAILLEPETS